MWGNSLWIASPSGIWKHHNGKNKKVHERTDITTLYPAAIGLWAISKSRELLRVSNASIRSDDRVSSVLSLSASGSTLCVGTKDGVVRIIGTGDPEDILGKRDKGVHMTSVLSANGECWFAGTDGTVGRYNKKEEVHFWNLPPESTKVNNLTLWQENHLWVLTETGAWLTKIR